MLFQCWRPRADYEDMFCVGRHIVRDLATRTRSSTLPAATITVSDPVVTVRRLRHRDRRSVPRLRPSRPNANTGTGAPTRGSGG
jgi:hypothetical protein